MTSVVTTTSSVRLMPGSVTDRKTRHSFAPSRRAASASSDGTAFTAADKISAATPRLDHTATNIRQYLLTAAASSQATGLLPGISVQSALSSPV